ncbi:MAG TPA: hypothetical protein VN887_15570 [Candidatus Angelobacter sp.]|nr:hypothetical protein [Candidatus Angelobacter sp.]
MRVFRGSSNVTELQIAARKFEPAHRKGPTVWLVGVSHIGETNYYQTLQKILDGQAVVLFEGVGERPHSMLRSENASRVSTENNSRSGEDENGFSLQSNLARSLGLAFQLEAIDYDRPNFRNSDLSIREIRQLMSGERELPSGPSTNRLAQAAPNAFEGLLQIMDGSSFAGAIAQLAVKFVGSSPKLQALTRLAMSEALGQIKGDISQLRGLPPDMKQLLEVLIQSRNARVVRDIKDILPTLHADKSVAVFYGAGHMANLEAQIRRDLKYRPVGELWFPAITVNAAKAGLTETEMKMVRSVVSWQLQMMGQ